MIDCPTCKKKGVGYTENGTGLTCPTCFGSTWIYESLEEAGLTPAEDDRG